MKIVWVDVCFAINFCADYLICLLAARFCAVPLERLRYALAALLGALWAVGAAVTEAAVFLSPGGKLLAAAVMCLAAFYGRRELPRLCAAFFALSAALGGAVWALSGAGDGASLSLSPALLGLSFFLFWAAFSVFLRGSGKKQEREILDVEMSFRGRSVRIRALRDTGNSLCDPLSGAGVMVMSPAAAAELFRPYEALLDLRDPAELLACAGETDALRGQLRLIPYSAVGSKGFLAAFRPDSLSVNGKKIRDLLVALSPSASGDGFDAII